MGSEPAVAADRPGDLRDHDPAGALAETAVELPAAKDGAQRSVQRGLHDDFAVLVGLRAPFGGPA